MPSTYSNLSRAQLTYEYLHTNSTTHEFLFGALAELVDNSRDAEATELQIYTVPTEKFRGDFILCFKDNGCGMDAVEVSQVIQFGRSSKREAGSNQVGQYGNGLKSGTMRIGKDMILFTKKDKTMSCLFLSRTFHETEDIHEVIVPMPSWTIGTKEPFVAEGHSLERHEVELSIITKYSPFKTKEEILSEFEKIPNKGTCVMIYNLKLMDNDLPELDIKKDKEDIIMADPHSGEVYDIDENILPEQVSFRAYLSVIYCEPRMKVYIQGEKIRTRKIAPSLYKPRSYVYTSNRFKKRSELEAEIAEKQAKIAEEKAKELTTQAREANEKYVATTKEGRTAIQLAVSKADQAKFDAEVKKRIADAKRKSSKEPKTLSFTFGFNIEKRRCDGIFIYNCNRLIKMYEKVGPQTEGGVKCAGVVGVVDVPYLVLEPTHNKQDFADHKEYKHLLKSMGDHMVQYWKDSKIENQGITKFWDDFGYSGHWRDDPSSDSKYKMKRLMSIQSQVQCDKCLKWRSLSFTRKMVNQEIPSDWDCANNTDSNFALCTKPEQKTTIPTGRLQKEIRNLNEKRADDVRKLQEKLASKQSEITRKKKERSPSPSPPRKSRRRRSPSPVTRKPRKNVPSLQKPKRAKSPSSPAKKSRKARSPSPPPPPRRQRKQKSPSPPPKKPLNRTPEKRKSLTSLPKIAAKLPKTTENHIDEPTSDIYPMGSKVEGKINNSWFLGSVVAFKTSSGSSVRLRVKFDKNTQDKFDKWFYETDATLRPYNADNKEVEKDSQKSEKVLNHGNNTDIAPVENDNIKGELLEKVTYLLSRCLCYFRAPDFKIQKKEILSLTPQQLRDFPLSTFFDDYERNIKKQLHATRENLSVRAEDAEKQYKECSGAKSSLEKEVKELKQQNTKTSKTLKELRQGVNVMLRSILNEDEKLDPTDVSDNVDIYLKTIVDQINESNNS